MQLKKRPKRYVKLATQRVRHIKALIEGMSVTAPPTWAAIVGLVRDETGVLWSRQALQAHDDIKTAYTQKRNQFRTFRKTGKIPREPVGKHLVLENKIRELTSENQKLRKTLGEYDVLLAKYMFNALNHGVTQEQLERPLIPPNRGQTERKKENGAAGRKP